MDETILAEVAARSRQQGVTTGIQCRANRQRKPDSIRQNRRSRKLTQDRISGNVAKWAGGRGTRIQFPETDKGGEVGNHADNGGKHATKMHNEKTTRKLPIRATAGIDGMGRRAGVAVGMLGRGREEIGQFESDVKEAIRGD